MTEQDVKQLICELFLDGDTSFELDPDANLLEDGICDSLGLVRMAGVLEKRIPGARIHDQEITRDNLGSIRRIVTFVGRKQTGR